MKRSTTIVDVEAFKTELGLEEDTLSELYMGFMEELDEQRELLINYHISSHFDKAGKIIHNIKGISGSYHAGRVYRLSTELDAAFKENRLEILQKRIPELAEQIRETEKEIRNCFATDRRVAQYD